ncbi:hypothetical protein NNW97_15585 [Streptomyces parvus]|nr:hypothetical protein [Streptomyces parvus]MCQ1578330.1 hypothetical protein [Streptomyces parvus]
MPFADLTPATAPPASRRAMEAVTERLDYRPAAVARLAASPHALDGFLKISAIFDACTLDPLSREVVVMTMATRNETPCRPWPTGSPGPRWTSNWPRSRDSRG